MSPEKKRGLSGGGGTQGIVETALLLMAAVFRDTFRSRGEALLLLLPPLFCPTTVDYEEKITL